MRVLIVDLNHMAHTYFHAPVRLSKTVNIGGMLQTIDTTIDNGIIKAIHRWSKGGYYPTAICMDRPLISRRAYFKKHFPQEERGYKEGRFTQEKIFESLDRIQSIFINSGITCYCKNNFEADDLVFACINKVKREMPGVPIDVVTNDADLLPLVDDVVSVFYRSKKNTYAEEKDNEKSHYIQVTPRNYQEVVEDLTMFKKFKLPYNTVLLHKMLRGDPSDIIPGLGRMFCASKFNRMIEEMEEDCIDFSIFRYGEVPLSFYTKTGEQVFDMYSRQYEGGLDVKVSTPQELKNILDVLRTYAPKVVKPDEVEQVLDHVRKVYWGMNLNTAYIGLGKDLDRLPAVLEYLPTQFSDISLANNARQLGINVPVGRY